VPIVTFISLSGLRITQWLAPEEARFQRHSRSRGSISDARGAFKCNRFRILYNQIGIL
jgi:hypothetical protein